MYRIAFETTQAYVLCCQLFWQNIPYSHTPMDINESWNIAVLYWHGRKFKTFALSMCEL
jgi:hypothetical protein